MELWEIFGSVSSIHPRRQNLSKRFSQYSSYQPSDTRWLSQERCIRAIYREFPDLIITLQQLYEASGDAEAYGLSAVLASFTGIASVVFLCEVLDVLARMNAIMQRKHADFSKLPVILKATTDQLVESQISQLKEKHGITLNTVTCGSTRSRWFSISTIAEYRTQVAIIIDALLEIIKSRFTDKAVEIITAMSIFNPSLLPTEDSLHSYGTEEIKVLAEFYGKEAQVQYAGITYTSPPLLDKDDLLSEWKIFRRAFLLEKKSIWNIKLK